MLLFPLNVSKFHHYVWWQHKTFDLTLTLSQSCGSVSTKMTDPRNIFSLRSLQQLFLPQHSSEHHPKIQSCIRISTCCYGNRHPAFPARLVWPELVVPFNKKKKSFTYRCFSHWNAIGHCQVLLLKRASVGEPSAKAGCPVKPSPKHWTY